MEFSSERSLRSRRRERERKRSAEEHPQLEPTIEYEPLIPSNILNPASQRLWLVSIFILMQSWKIYDVVLLKAGIHRTIAAGLLPLNGFTFVVKYAIAEGLFLWLLPVLNIQYLTFSPLQTLLLTFFLNGYTFVLASDTTIPIISGVILPIWRTVYKRKELTVAGETVSPQQVIDMSSHFKGRLTINYLPDLSAKFNPFKYENLCIIPEAKTITLALSDVTSTVYMPIEFNTTNSLGSLVIQHTNPYNKVSYVNYTNHDLNKLAKRDHSHLSSLVLLEAKRDHRVFYLEVPLKEPGMYKIHSVTDSNGLSIRTYKSTFVLLHCPSALFVYPKSAESYNKPICVKQNPLEIAPEQLEIPLVSVFGVAPLKLKFISNVGSSSQRDFEIQVALDDVVDKERSLTDITWLAATLISRNFLEQEILLNPSIVALNKIEPLEFYLSEVIDSLGHLTRYNPSSRSQDVFYSIDLRLGPSILLTQPNPNEYLLINGTKLIHVQSSNVKSTDFPLNVEFSCYLKKGQALVSEYNFTKIFVDIADLRNGIEVDKEGVYSIVGGLSQFCPCIINKNQKSVEVKVAPLPEVQIIAEPIVDKCVGITGYQFEFDFTGTPPYQIHYQVFRKQKNGVIKPVYNEHGSSIRHLKSYESKFKYVYKPPAEGTYLVMFNKLKDLNYQRQGIQLDEDKHTYETYFKKRSSASFIKPGSERSFSRNLCLNKDSVVPIYLSGNPPFSLKYSIIEKNTNRKLIENAEVSDIQSDFYEIKTPVFEFGGEFQIILSEVKDSLSCDVDFDYQTEVYTIKTRNDIPSVSFNEKVRNKEIKIVEGDSLKLPLELKSSIGPSSQDQILYSITDINDPNNVERFNLRNVNSFFIKKEGIYQLESLNNGGCSGEISPTKETVTVRYYERPTLEVYGGKDGQNILSKIENTIHLKPICQYGQNEINLKLHGVAPFVIDYDIVLPSGKCELRTMVVEEHSFKINPPTGESGKYKHHFKAVYDKLYTKEKSRGAQQLNSTISYTINELPDASFEKSFIQICESNVNKEGVIAEIPIKLVGAYPFNISLSFQTEQTGKVEKFFINQVSEPILRFQEFHDSLTVGNHILTMNDIVDGNGCKRQDIVDSKNGFVISITEVPNISKLGGGHKAYKNLTTTTKTKSLARSHYCVGDHIRYNMSGIAPFTVFYNFNGVAQKAELSPPLFQRLASKSGNLSITALLDSASNQCLVNFTTQENSNKFEQLQIQIFDLPSVEINHGDYLIQNLNEGDQTEIVFTFKGVPPFAVTYVRTIEEKSGNKVYHKVVETNTIRDIWGYQHSVGASLEGTYEAIEVKDAFCIAQREV